MSIHPLLTLLLSTMTDYLTPLLLLAPALAAFSWLRYKGLEHILIHYRWIFVILFLMPVSLVYDVYMYVRSWLIFKLNSAPHMHDEKVKEVQRQVS